MPQSPVFESWDLRRVGLPPRSRLYALEPMGIGTPFVESLTGYVSRLADAHAVSVADLFDGELSTFASKRLLTIRHGFHAQTYGINGFGKRCRKWVAALQRATQQADLRFLTLLPLKGLFSRIGLFRCTRAWCPDCYDHWRVSGGVVYEPLLWAIAPVTVCLLHGRDLEEVCPHCQGRQAPIAVYSRPGYCSRCQQWLGDSEDIRSSNHSTPFNKKDDVALWHAKTIGELFAATPSVSSPLSGKVFTANFRACVNGVAEGNQQAFGHAVRVSCYAVSCHLAGEALPQIRTLLRICYRLQIPLTAFLENTPASTSGLWEQAKKLVRTGRKLPLSRTAADVRCILKSAVHEQPPPSLLDIARRLDYRGVDRLYQVDPILSKRIAANYHQSGKGHWWRKPEATRICERSKIRRLLEDSLAKERPVSVHYLSASLGYLNDGYIRQRFPDLCRAISQKIEAQKIARFAAVKRFLGEAVQECSVPTLHDLAKRLGYASADPLRRHFPDLCRQILARQHVAREQRIAELRKTLQSVLQESPAPSFSSVCKRIGLSRSFLEDICPKQSAAIQSRFLRNRREASQRRKNELGEEVRQIVRELHRQGKCPSMTRVTGLLGKTTLREWVALTAALKTARKELVQAE